VVTSAINTPVVQLVMATAMAGVVWLAFRPQIMSGVTAAEFVAFIGAAGALAKPIRALTEVNDKIQRGIAASTSVFALLDMEQERDTGSLTPERVHGEVEFREVRFAYPGSEDEVLHGISFQVPAGKTVALVGRSGSGKSTLVSLLPRFYDASAGEIQLDGVPVDQYRLNNLRRHIASVSQKVMLFNDTIAANIAYGETRVVSREEIEQAARIAHAHDFISELPLGYDTPVGQDGVQLSGGQRQRIAIARALLKNAPVLILDEATSALDNESEYHIQAALEQVMKDRTTFVIAHRLSTIEKADLILVMDRGCIVESGTHEELLGRGGLYAQLHSRRFEDEGGPETVAV
jgi:subfamily B ATP-binding cassette protein MsbA